MKKKTVSIHGRVLAREKDAHGETWLTLSNVNGSRRLRVTETAAKTGDIVRCLRARGTVRYRVEMLTPNRRDGRMDFQNSVLNPRRLHAITIREQTEAAIRAFFSKRDFRETRTPLLVPCPGMEPHIKPFEVKPFEAGSGGGNAFLPTSPEFAMKRLLVGGLEKIFQICPSFRCEPKSTTHLPEFTMLEWYRAYASYEEIMKDTEELFAFAARMIHGKASVRFQGRDLSLRTPWPRLRVRDLFQKHAGIDLVKSASVEALRRDCERLSLRFTNQDTWDDLYFRIWLNLIEPKLPQDRAVFVIGYPPSQAALAVVEKHRDGSRWARRFETYAGGIELGNAFEELTDPVEQRRRFVEDMELRERTYGTDFPKNPLDEEFLAALEEGLPPSAGIAVGVDRMVMLLADEPDIQYTFWL